MILIKILNRCICRLLCRNVEQEIIMNCCKCNCSFAKCVEERKEALTKEFQQMIENWMEEHPEVGHIYMREDTYCLTSNSMFIYPHRKYKVTIHFE